MTELARFSGDIRFGPIDGSGVFQGYYPPIEVDSFTPGREDGDETVLTSKRRDTYGQNIFSEKQAGTTTLSLGILEQPSWLLATAFSGNDTVLDVTGDTATAEALTATVLGRDYKLAQFNVSNLVVTNAAADVTYVLDTDYSIIDARLGLIRILSTGSITGGQPLLVTYDYASFDGYQILGETVTEKSFRIYADLQNRVTGKDLSLEYFNVRLSAPDVFDMLSSDIITVTLEGIASTPAGQTSPYRVIGNNVATV